MQNSEEKASEPTKLLKRQQPLDIWIIIYWSIEFLKIVGIIRNFIWLFRNSVRALRRLYHAVTGFFHSEAIHEYPVAFEKPHVRAISRTTGLALITTADIPDTGKLTVLRVPVHKHY